MELNAKSICDALGINEEEVVNIYPYGSRVYGTDDEFSDDDFIIVFKSSMIKSRDGRAGFKNNAISSEDGSIQGVCYSRGGFIDAINNYEIAAWECLSLPDEKVIKNKWPFKVRKYEEKQMIKAIITKASSSWHIASKASSYENYEQAEKGIFHTLRILELGLQIKEHQKIVNFQASNELWEKMLLDKGVFTKEKIKKYLPLRDEAMNKLKN